jgi:hypothetical protein
VVTKNGAPLITLVAPPNSGDGGVIGTLDVGETWTWTNVAGGTITALTTFVATGHGFANGTDVTVPASPTEQATATVTIANTAVTITPSATAVVSGQSVTLTVTEQNTGSVALTSPSVVVTKNGAPLITLVAPPNSGDGGVIGTLDVGETWTWTNVAGGTITALTTFVATGHGFTNGTDVTAPGSPTEQATATVTPANTAVTITPSATAVVSGQSVTLTVTEQNTGSVALTSPSVVVTKNGAPLVTLVAPPNSGDVGVIGTLDVGETWTWTNVAGGTITALTTFVATGHGFANGTDVTVPAAPTEQATATVTVANTAVTIAASPNPVVIGGTVTLTVTEQNTGLVALTSPSVVVTRSGPGTIPTLVAPPTSGDAGVIGTLDVGETWTWTGVSAGGPINAATIFTATGHGFYNGTDVTFPTSSTEQSPVTVLVGSTILDMTTTSTQVPPGGGNVTLTITDRNNGDIPLTNPHVVLESVPTVTSTLGDSTPITLDKTHYYVSGDNNPNGVMDPNETWRWQVTVFVGQPVTFTASGHGTMPNGVEVTPDGPQGLPAERDTLELTSKPELRIFKFNDLDKDGVLDHGEWDDANNDGVLDSGDGGGLEGWHFVVTHLGIMVFEGDTGPDGWLIRAVDPGLYRVTETTQKGWQSTTPTSVLATVPDDGSATVEFGNRRERLEVPPAVPTMGQWGMIAMATLLAGSMIWVVRKRQTSSGSPKAR